MSRLATKTGLLVALLAVLGLPGGCGPASNADPAANAVETPMTEIVLTAKDEGSQVELSVGQTLIVSLESNPTTGYGWEVAGSTEPALRQVGETEFEPQSDLLGAPGVEILRFQASGPGKIPLELIYHRSWEKGVEPLKSFSVQVVVR